MGAKDVSERWLKASRALKKVDQVYGQRLAEMAKRHASEASYYLDDPLEAAVFSVLVEMMKTNESIVDRKCRINCPLQLKIHHLVLLNKKFITPDPQV